MAVEPGRHRVVADQAFAIEGFHGRAAAAFAVQAVVGQVLRLMDPSAATRTLHWGRNYLYAAELEGPAGRVPVVVKQFRNQGWRKVLDRRLRGSKAERAGARRWRRFSCIEAGYEKEPITVISL